MSGTLLLVLGGNCRRLVVVVVGCGVGTMLSRSNLLVRRRTGRIVESFLQLVGELTGVVLPPLLAVLRGLFWAAAGVPRCAAAGEEVMH